MAKLSLILVLALVEVIVAQYRNHFDFNPDDFQVVLKCESASPMRWYFIPPGGSRAPVNMRIDQYTVFVQKNFSDLMIDPIDDDVIGVYECIGPNNNILATYNVTGTAYIELFHNARHSGLYENYEFYVACKYPVDNEFKPRGKFINIALDGNPIYDGESIDDKFIDYPDIMGTNYYGYAIVRAPFSYRLVGLYSCTFQTENNYYVTRFVKVKSRRPHITREECRLKWIEYREHCPGMM